MIHATQDYAHNNINTTGNPSLEGDLTGPFMSYISLSVIAADGEYQREANNNPWWQYRSSVLCKDCHNHLQADEDVMEAIELQFPIPNAGTPMGAII